MKSDDFAYNNCTTGKWLSVVWSLLCTFGRRTGWDPERTTEGSVWPWQRSSLFVLQTVAPLRAVMTHFPMWLGTSSYEEVESLSSAFERGLGLQLAWATTVSHWSLKKLWRRLFILWEPCLHCKGRLRLACWRRKDHVEDNWGYVANTSKPPETGLSKQSL